MRQRIRKSGSGLDSYSNCLFRQQMEYSPHTCQCKLAEYTAIEREHHNTTHQNFRFVPLEQLFKNCFIVDCLSQIDFLCSNKVPPVPLCRHHLPSSVKTFPSKYYIIHIKKSVAYGNSVKPNPVQFH